jgi:AcrR family transcriptional regulator
VTTSRQAKAGETRERIIAAARLLFATKGYFQTGTNEIVQAAQVGTRGALYHHFADKEALFTAVFEVVEQAIATKASLTNTGGTGFEVLSQALNSYLDVSSADEEVRRIVLIDGPAVLGWESWRRLEAEHGLGAIRNLLRAGQADQSMLVPDDVEALANMLLSIVNDGALFIAHADQPGQARTHAGAALNALLSGLAANSAGSVSG